MLGRIVKGERLIEVRSGFSNISRKRQCDPHEAMRDHERDGRPLLLGERQELRRKLAHQVAVERHIGAAPEALEHRKLQQWIVERLSQLFSLFDQVARLTKRRFRLGRRMALDVRSERSRARPEA